MTDVLLIIDMQEDFFAHARLAEQRSLLVANTNALVSLAREASIRVIWVRQEFLPDLSDAPLEVKRQKIEVVVAGTPGAQILPELNRQQSDEHIVKKRYSAFFGTDLDDRLSRLGCTRLIIAGINTHACIRATVVDAYQRDYDVILAKDCIASHDQEHHEISWRYMEGKLGVGMTNSQIEQALNGR